LVTRLAVLQQKAGLCAQLQRQRRREAVAIDELLVAVTARILACEIQAKCRCLAHCHVVVAFEAAQLVGAKAEHGFAEGLAEPRFFGDAVDQPAR